MFNLRAILFLFITVLSPMGTFAQKNVIIHQPQAELKLPGLLRPFKPVLAKYTFEIHPGWLVKEIFDSSKQLTMIECLDPRDTDRLIVSILSYPYTNLDSAKWAQSKEYFRTRYGDKGIGLKDLSETDTIAINPPNGILAVYEVVAKFPDHLEYLAQIVTRSETLLFKVPLATEEYGQRIDYFRRIVSDLKTR